MWVCRVVRLISLSILDAKSVAGHLVEADSVFVLLEQHRRVLFPAEFMTDLFLSRSGRPSVPADMAASILVLQTLHGRNREAMAAVGTDLRWQVACACRSATRVPQLMGT